jgi:Txe/YoeB family toxin of toxin-antitoxin system
VVSWRIVFTRQAQRDAKKLAASGLRPKAEALLEILAANPFKDPPPFEKLVGDLTGAYSRRINIHNRLVYQVLPDVRTVKVIRMNKPFDSGPWFAG